MTELRSHRSRPTLHRLLRWFVIGLVAYLAIAYVILPFAWQRYEYRHPAFDDLPGITTTGNGIPGDPINVGIIGSQKDLIRAMLAAKWHPADPLSLKSSLEIAEATVFHREYADAPVSNLFYWGRKEDLAFEQPVGPDPKERHHVRYWKSNKTDSEGRPFWAGSVTFDKSVGLSDTTLQITHHIGPDVDAERDRLIAELKKVGAVAKLDIINGFHHELSGRNGGGDPWHTDGRLFVAVLNNLFPAPGKANSK